MKNSSKKEKTTARVLLTRILAGILAALLMAGTLFTLLAFILDTQAEEISELDRYAFSDRFTEGNYRVAVALHWYSNADSAYGVVSPYGFAFGEADIQRDLRSFTPVWLCDETDIVVATDRNMKYYGDSLIPAESEADSDIGGYNVELCFSTEYLEQIQSILESTDTVPETTEEQTPVPSSSDEPRSSSATDSTAINGEPEATGSVSEQTTADPGNPAPEYGSLTTEIWDTLEELSELFSLEYDHVFPAYINGEHKLRIGAFASYSEASAAAANIGAQLEGYDISVVSPSPDGIMILNGDLDTILFEYSGEGSCCGGICARQVADSDRYYLCLSEKYLYDGIFCFRRYERSSYSNLTLINLVPLLEYCEGVISAEIGGYWPLETTKAFAVAVNSFTIKNLNYNYTVYGCDLLDSVSNQRYNGVNGVNSRVISACEAVKHTILTYTDEDGNISIADCMYSSSHGGSTSAPQYTWLGEIGDYLCAQPTMWEDYINLPGWANGFWTSEATPYELASMTKKYTGLNGSYITGVSYETVPGSTHLYSLTLTDNTGASATILTGEKIRYATGSLTHSSNFVIGKDSVSYTWDEVLSTSIIDLSSNYSGNLSVKTSTDIFSTSASLLDFITHLGQADKDDSAAMYVRTSSGIAVLASESDIPLTTLPGADGVYTYVSDYGSFLIVNTLKQHNETLTARNSGDFVVAGKGWGHGNGMSQWGAEQLGEAGALYHQILYAYYPGTALCRVEDYLN